MSLTATLTSAWSVALPFADAPPKLTDAGNTQLLLAALAGIAAVVLLISWAKFHPFLALIIGAAVMGGVAGVQPADIVTSFTKGLGSTTGSVGLLIALGAMIGKLLRDSGGSETIVDRLIGGVSPRRLPWMMALIAFILGIPLFFEVGVVLLVPVVILVARKLDLSLMKVGIPALAGLSILHGFVPPHPGPLLAIDIVKADLSTVLLYGLVISVPTLIVSGPLLARFVDQWVPVHASGAPGGSDAGPTQTQTQTQTHSRPQTSASEAPRLTKRPGFVPAVLSITLPVILMLLRAIGELTLDEENGVRKFLEFLGTPAVALLLGVLVSMFFLGFRTGMNRSQVEKSVGSALPGIAGILLIVAAGGGFKQMLVDAGVGAVIGDLAKGIADHRGYGALDCAPVP
jgi:GntP family gluconate:H+ symporter